MIEIRTEKIRVAAVTVPGSKSYSHRLLIAAALSDGKCCIRNILKSEDTLLTMGALKQMGAVIEDGDSGVIVGGTNGQLLPCSDPVYLENSGTSIPERFQVSQAEKKLRLR